MDIPIELIKITESFLSNRNFNTNIENSISSTRLVCTGIPQGSFLSPTLFNIYTNDMPSHANANVSLFADDTMFSCTNTNPRIAIIQLQRQIHLAADWFGMWRLRINEAKTIAFFFGRKDPQNIVWSNNLVTIDRQLNFVAHISTTIKNRNSSITARSRINLIKLYVLPILMYAGAAWAPFISKTKWQKLETVQPIGIRTIAGLPKFVRNTIILHSVDLQTVKDSVKTLSAAMFHKASTFQYNHIQVIRRSERPRMSNKFKTLPRPLEWSNI